MAKRRRGGAGFARAMQPAIEVGMLLAIIFQVAPVLSEGNRPSEVDVAEAEVSRADADTPGEDELPPAQLRIGADASGNPSYQLDGAPVTRGALMGALPEGTTRVLLRVDPALPFVAIQPLLVELANAGITPMLEASPVGGGDG